MQFALRLKKLKIENKVTARDICLIFQTQKKTKNSKINIILNLSPHKLDTIAYTRTTPPTGRDGRERVKLMDSFKAAAVVRQ